MATLFDLTFAGLSLSQCDDVKAYGAKVGAAEAGGLGESSPGLEIVLAANSAEAWVEKDFTLSTDDFRWRIYIEPSDLTMANGNAFDIVDIQDASTTRLKLTLQYDTDHLELVATVYDDGGSPASTSDVTVSASLHYVEVYYERATSDVASDGALELWVDGESKATIASVDNYDVFRNMQKAYLGAKGIDSGTTGTLYLDEFEANDTGDEIGGDIGGEVGGVGSVIIATTRVALNAGTGNQDITTTDCGGETPKAALFLLQHADNDGSPRAGAVLAIGATTGTAERWSYSSESSSGAADADCEQRGATDICMLKQFATGGSGPDFEADLVGFITNGARINITNAPQNQWLMTAIFVCGDDALALADTFNPNATQDAYVDVVTSTWEPDVVLLFNYGRALNDANNANIYDAHGAVVNDGSQTQRCSFFHSEDGTAAQEVHGYVSENRASGQLSLGGGGFHYTLEVTQFNSNGFRVYTRDGAGDSADDVCFLALNFNGVAQVWLDTVTAPAGTGSDSVTGVGFTPQFIFQSVTHMPATATHYATGSAGSYGFSAITENAQYCVSIQQEDAAAAMVTQSCTDDTAIWLEEHDGTDGHTASLTSLDTDGWTLNYTTNATGAVKFWAVAVSDVTVGGGGERGTGRGIMRHVMRGV